MAEHRPPAGDRADDTTVLLAAVDRLRAEAEGLRRAMRTRGVIEQAKGMLTERLGCTPDEAFGHLVRLSQDTNRRVADIAAGLVGLAAPVTDPSGDESLQEAVDAFVRPARQPPELLAPASAPPVPAPPGATRLAPVPGLAARYHLAVSALAGAETPEELARLVHEVATAPLGVIAVVLGLLEPDGALVLVGSHGVEPGRVSRWRRIPPETGVPLVTAAHGGGMVWEFDADDSGGRSPETGRIVPGRTACAVPLRSGDRIVGAMSLGWDGPPERARAATRYLDALAGLVAGHLLRVAAAGGGEPGLVVPGGEYWFRGVLDAMFEPVLVLSVVREGGGARAVTDLRVRYANAAAGPAPMVGRRLTEILPGLVATGVFARILDAAGTGVRYDGRAGDFTGGGPGTVLAVRAVPFLDGLLLTWRPGDGAAEAAARAGATERLAGVGSFAWSRGGPGLELSAEARRLLGLDPGRPGPVRAADALAGVRPPDRAAVRAFARLLLGGRRPAAVDVGVGPGDAGARTVRISAEPVGDPDTGRARDVRGVLQDVTERHRAEQALAGVRSKLAEQQRRTAAEHRTTRALRMMAAPEEPAPPIAGLDHAARFLPAGDHHRVGGGWYDLTALPGGPVLLAVGDVGGHGPTAAVGASELRHALRGLCGGGLDPAGALGRLNTVLCRHGSRRLVGVLCGLLDPAARTLTWSAAGQAPPAVVRGATADLANGPTGTALGAIADARYRDTVQPLCSGDTVLFWTDGLLDRREAGPDHPDRLLRAAEESAAEELAAEGFAAAALADFLEHIADRLGDPGPADGGCLLAVRLQPAR
ncbi:SpoIIE family protein phosphatase [Streptomyces sp. SP17BM10]|uniref:SpoIIE family protein phosphatase n=1 Tax=Streptomyces sp. SP17BM10 TaxID=3002530 RepID=UPI002E791E07|nr:SpoIIE family protein phosphatase [Streptomyces sp. SP17BM10]MEE1787078.1 SpoIIE family protein phosphatase [Streptomyces sp. SP17BM10]